MACGYKAAARDVPGTLLLLLLLLMVMASLATVTRCAWVGDYASDHGCGKTFVEALCDPADAGKNHACSDACHYNGCGGGRCVYVGAARGCYCKP